MKRRLRSVASIFVFGLGLATGGHAQHQPRNEIWVRLGANLPQSRLVNVESPTRSPETTGLRVRMANAFAGGVTFSRVPRGGGVFAWRVTGMVVPTVQLRGTSDRDEPGTLYGLDWGTGYYLSAETLPQRSLGRTSLYGVLGGGARVIEAADRSCIPEDLSCYIGVGGPQTWAPLANIGGGATVTVRSYTFGAEVVNQLSRNRGRLEHDIAVLGTLRLAAW